jgi:Flp pilus assembly protein TadB
MVARRDDENANEGMPVVDWKTFVLSQFRERDIAVKLSIKEVRRRLAELNHAHAKAQADRDQFVTKLAVEPWKDGIEKRINGIEREMAEARGRAITQAVFVSVLVSLVISIIAGVVVRMLVRV